MKKILLIIFILVACFVSLASSVQAQVQLETGLPTIPNNRLPAGTELPSYINYLFIFGLGAIAILALGRMMFGGIKYILAAGNVGDKADAKDVIQQALLGLGVLLASYLLLKTINPDLVNLKNPNLTPPQFQNLGGLGGLEETKLVTKQYIGPYANAEAGQPCSPNGVMSPGLLVCQNGKWAIMPF